MYDPLIVDTFIQVHTDIAPLDDYVSQGKEGLTVIARALTTTETGAPGSRLDDIAASTEEMLVLYDLAQALTGRLDLPDAADVISKHIRRIVPASTCVFYVYDVKSDELYAAHAAGENLSQFSGVRIPRGQRLTGWVAANKQTILNSDPVLDLGEAGRSMRPRLRSCLSTPLISDGELVGVLTLYSTQQNAFAEDHGRIIEAVARQVAQTVRHAIELKQNRIGNLPDQLAELPSLQHLRGFVEAEMSTENEPGTLSLILIEFRPPKGISRNSGNSPLGLVVEAIKKVLRGADVLYRYGTDEFVVLLTQTDRQAALGVADRIAAKIAEQSLESQGSDHQRLAVELGVASAPTDGTSLEALVSVARRRERGGLNPPPQTPRSVH
jgi:diguanylate cyclase (GGDEF)-like protein